MSRDANIIPAEVVESYLKVVKHLKKVPYEEWHRLSMLMVEDALALFARRTNAGPTIVRKMREAIKEQQLLHRDSIVIINSSDLKFVYFVKYKLELTRNARRRSRRYYVFTDNRDKEHRVKKYFKSPDEAHSWAKQQLGQDSGIANFKLQFYPIEPQIKQVYQVTT